VLANANTNQAKSVELALVGLYAFIMLYFFPRGSYIWFKWPQIFWSSYNINLHTWL